MRQMLLRLLWLSQHYFSLISDSLSFFNFSFRYSCSAADFLPSFVSDFKNCYRSSVSSSSESWPSVVYPCRLLLWYCFL